MKKKTVKLKILLTNIRRIIMSFLFVNLGTFFQNNVKAVGTLFQSNIDVSCYWAGPTTSNLSTPITTGEKIVNFFQEHVFILIVPIALIILLIIFIAKKKKEEIELNKEVERRIKEKHEKQD